MSIGFWVATIMNGVGSGCTTPSTVTVDSSASSSSADWVRGVARFSSSNTTMLANTGPGRNVMLSMSRRPLGTIEPVMSPGSRSEVPWIRWNVPPTLRASTWASSVLPTPGMSSISRWPPDSSVATATSATSCLPAITASMVPTSWVPSAATSLALSFSRSGPGRSGVGRGHGRRRQGVHGRPIGNGGHGLDRPDGEGGGRANAARTNRAGSLHKSHDTDARPALG